MKSFSIDTPDEIYLDNGTMKESIAWLIDNVTEEDIFIDVGAHIGCVFVPVVGTKKPFRALAFEPAEETFEFLERNCRQLGRYEIYNKAVSNFTGEGEMYDADWGSPSHSIIDRFEGKRPTFPIDVIRLNDIEFEDRPIVMKIDAELSEPEVWDGMTKLFPQIKGICMELFNEAYKAVNISVTPFLEKIRENGFSIFNFKEEPMTNKQILSLRQVDVIIKK